MQSLNSAMEVYGVMCPFCGTMMFKEKSEEMTATVECELCKKAFEPKEIISGITAEQLLAQYSAA